MSSFLSAPFFLAELSGSPAIFTGIRPGKSIHTEPCHMSHNFIDDLLCALDRVLTPDAGYLKDILIISGMPEKTANLRYLAFNRQVFEEEGRRREFSAVAVLNNRRAEKWRHRGLHKKISRLVFHSRWTFNPLDLFLNGIRCHSRLMDTIAAAPGRYTLLGILQTTEMRGPFDSRSRRHCIRPILAMPGIGNGDLKTVVAFEMENEICKSGFRIMPLYRRIGRHTPA